MNVGGVDGCKGGWVMARYVNGKYDLEIYGDFDRLITENRHLHRILIDIPVGLSSKHFGRTIDSRIRSELKNRHSTVFNAPCRLAVYESDNEQARKWNRQIENKSLSIQSLSIRGKIKEVDEYLGENRFGIEVIESHPELCFKYLKRAIVQSKKTNTEGIQERLAIIGAYAPALVELYEEKQKAIKRKYAKRDDIIDAICLCLVNKLGAEDKLAYLVDNNVVDEKGIKIRIAYYQKQK
jgi:8-oxo-dGTP diphosphatase